MANAATVLDSVMDRNLFNQWFDDRMAQREAEHVPSMTIIATKGTLDMAYPPFILASTASALMRTKPESVNLIALFTKLSST